MTHLTKILAAGLIVASATSALAQTRDCAPTRATGDPNSIETRRDAPLGDQLARSDGVLCPPPNVSPDMRVPPPADAGSANTPVIPPPGSAGGDQSVRPR